MTLGVVFQPAKDAGQEPEGSKTCSTKLNRRQSAKILLSNRIEKCYNALTPLSETRRRDWQGDETDSDSYSSLVNDAGLNI